MMVMAEMYCSYNSDATISHMNPRSRVVITSFIAHIQCPIQRYW